MLKTTLVKTLQIYEKIRTCPFRMSDIENERTQNTRLHKMRDLKSTVAEQPKQVAAHCLLGFRKNYP